MHELGHAAGLAHCSAGDNDMHCAARQTESGGDPESGTLMYRFIDGASDSLQSDDIAGIHELYDYIPSLLPSSGPYAPGEEEIDFIIKMRELSSYSGLYTTEGRKSYNRSLKGLEEFNLRRTGVTLSEQVSDFYNKASQQTENFTQEELRIQRMMLTAGLDTAARLKEDQKNGILSIDPEILDRVIQGHTELRSRTIDRLMEAGYE
jgi:hypothetical protein